RLLERLLCSVKAALVHVGHAAEVGDPCEPGFVPELAQKALALAEQPTPLVEVRLVEAQDAKRPLDLALVVPLARQGEALASISSRVLGLAQICCCERYGAQCLASEVSVGIRRSFERGREPSAQLPQARTRPETPERKSGQTKLALDVARGDEPIKRSAEVVELWIQPTGLVHIFVGSAPSGRICKPDEVVGVPIGEECPLSMLLEPLGGVVPDRLQHPETLPLSPEQALVDQ